MGRYTINSVGERKNYLKASEVSAVAPKPPKAAKGGEMQRITKDHSTAIVIVTLWGVIKRSPGCSYSSTELLILGLGITKALYDNGCVLWVDGQDRHNRKQYFLVIATAHRLLHLPQYRPDFRETRPGACSCVRPVRALPRLYSVLQCVSSVYCFGALRRKYFSVVVILKSSGLLVSTIWQVRHKNRILPD